MRKQASKLPFVCTVLLATLLATPNASAFQIQSGFSDPCHETLTLAAADDSFADEFAVGDEVAVPTDEDWEAISESILDELGVSPSDKRERFLLVSLALGARWPDTAGHALIDSSTARDAHVDTDEQYNHALRREDDDYEKGNLAAVRGTREVIESHLDRATHFLSLPPEHQLLTRRVVVDYYGEIEIEVWAPAFHLGYAAHALQDSFSHSIRTENLKTILHVMNFTEATRGDLEEDRDGLAHSSAMDDCEVRASEIAASAQRATTELFQAYFNQQYRDQPQAVSVVLDEWMTYEPGCTLENDFCDSSWLQLAEEDPAQPFLRSTLGCQTADSRHFALWAMVLAFCAWWFRRRSRRTPGGQDAGPA